MTRNKDRRQHAKSATDRRHAKSAAALREALLSLLQRKPYDQITVVEICAEAGVHNATFFRHHTDKDALLDHVAADEIKSLVDISLPLGMELAGSRALCEYVHNRWTLWKALLNGGAGPAMRAEYLRISRKVAADVGRKSRWLPHELSIVLSTMMIVETLSWWLDQDPDAAGIDEVANIIDRLIHVPALDEPPPNRG
ncbi:MAG: TetR/AcrR family transcriptional regulator [Novosphingobium sp.]|nr:TetR/AcrR family transcriptional regulator [Novosphingobium sp.]